MSDVSSRGADSELGLRARRHLQTRADIVDAALTLFRERGFAAVTMEEVARAAGVSRSTAYRRFPTKEDVVLEVPKRRLEVFDAAVEALDECCTVAEAFRLTAEAVSTHIDQNQARVREAYAVLEQAPGLKSSGVATTAWLERLTQLAERYGGYDRSAAAILAGAYLGGIDAMMMLWVEAGATDSVLRRTRAMHRQVQPIFGQVG